MVDAADIVPVPVALSLTKADTAARTARLRPRESNCLFFLVTM
jgi:hypothetical protein